GGDAVHQLLEAAVADPAGPPDPILLGQIEREPVTELAGERPQVLEEGQAYRHDTGVLLVEPPLHPGEDHGLAVVAAAELALHLKAEVAIEDDVGAPIGQEVGVEQPARGAVRKHLRPPLVRLHPGFNSTTPIRRDSSSSRSTTSRTSF